MRRIVTLAAIVGVMAAPALRAQQQFQIFASIVDATGAAPGTLDPADLRVLENGAEGTIVRVEPISWPVKVQILVDNGAGLGSDNLIHLRNGVRGLIEALPSGVEMSLLTTAPQARFIVRPTTDRGALLSGIGRLAPDGGVGRFVESLKEATDRIAKDESSHFPVLIVVGTTAGDTNVLERDVRTLLQRLQQRAATVHIVMLSRMSATGGGANQTNVGIAAAQITGGRYEAIATPSGLTTLLPQIGEQVAKSHARQTHQFRITVQRPAGASGDIGEIRLAARSGLKAEGLSRDGHLP